MKFCPDHGAIVFLRASFCPLCGRRLTETDQVSAALAIDPKEWESGRMGEGATKPARPTSPSLRVSPSLFPE